MSWRYDFIPPWLVESETKSIILASKLNKMYFFDDVFLSLFNWDYLYLPVIGFLPDFNML